MSFEKEKEIFNNIYQGINGYSISHKGRSTMDPKDTKFLIYGEVSFAELLSIIENSGVKDGLKGLTTFCDLGSGTGMCLIGAALICPYFKHIIGVELVPTLYESSLQSIQQLAQTNKKLANKIKVVNGNFLKLNFAKPSLSPDVIFMHYPMHGTGAEELYLQLEEKLRKELKPGSIIISAIRKLSSSETFPEVLAPTHVQCKYGNVTIFFHKKV
ncbi:MAG: class I SAM-dependent methyltransferase [Puniceicoccales bacterium]|jgi:SAM-dependent methyltransferase|nr:class I SAM-dependent methyltransferase [Puniceicoccales bacterium]